ncbi:MAG: hypothetical protein F6J93_21005 [Oscillatoria sp. SIO1A7]|nr:hypothetical protein [Oscillatoria sp. SIO1A7]
MASRQQCIALKQSPKALETNGSKPEEGARSIPIDRLFCPKRQPRRYFDGEAMQVFTQDSQSSTALSWEKLQRTQPQLTPKQLEQYLKEAKSLVNCYSNFNNTEF